MNRKDVNEIKRRIRPDRSNVTHIYGCFVNSNKEIVSSFDESVGLLEKEESEKYFTLMKKALSGSLGRNLMDISFATKQVMDSEEHRLLSALRKSELQDEQLREEFFKCIIQAVNMEESFLILLAHDSYDVPHFGKDGHKEEDTGDVFKYILCCICPVKSGKAQFAYVPDEQRFHNRSSGQLVGAPELGFMFPAFDERAANIYSALFYSHNTKEIHQEFIDAVFRTPVPMSPAQQRESFHSAVTETLEKDCSLDVVQALHGQLSERIAIHKESKDPEPLTLSVSEVGSIMQSSGVEREKAEDFCNRCQERFGPDAALNPENIIDSRHFKLETPEVKISVDPKYSSFIMTRVIDGRPYILIPAESGVEVNGIDISIEEAAKVK